MPTEKALVPQDKIDQILAKSDVVDVIGRYVKLKSSGKNFKGLCPFHSEKTASFTVSPEKKNYSCYGCDAHGDVIKFIREVEHLEFRDALEFLEGGKIETVKMIPEKAAPKNKAEKEKIKIIPLNHEKAKDTYTVKTILKLCSGVFNGFGKKALPEDHKDYRKFTDISPWFPYYNADGLIDLMVVRLEDQNSKKEVLTYYFNGEYVAMKSYPVLIYGRDQLKKLSDLPVLIHEGEKCVELAKKELPEFVHITWNGGGKKFFAPDWSILKGREVFLLPDDDNPGLKTMRSLSLLLKGDYNIDAIEIPVFEKAKEIKKKGADIEEILQCYKPEEITKTILGLRRKGEKRNEENKKRPMVDVTADNSEQRNNLSEFSPHTKTSGENGYPFKILGIADDGDAYFLDHTDRMVHFPTTAISANMLSDIGTYNWFKQNRFHYSDPTAKDWLPVVDEIRIKTKGKDFDMEKVRGRGAWKDNEGNICYHDGKKTTGKYDPEWTFIRKPQKKIGITSQTIDFGIRSEIINTAHNFSFATPADCVRFFSWAVLAPFSGALVWRPAFQLTGESGTGKSTLMNLIRKISSSLTVNGGSTTEAAIRQYCGTDSGSTIVDEAESKNHRDRERIEGIFSLMRASTTDDSPKTIKGSKNGTATVFEMRQMFGFVAINASVDNVADDNRIIRINLKQNNRPGYAKNIKKIKELLTHKNCEGIRSFTWKNLTKIIGLSERLGYIIQEVTKQDQRYSDGESILLAANMIVWENHRGDEDDDFLHEYVTLFYQNQTQEEKRDETEEMVNRLLDETALIGPDKEKMSFRFVLIEMKKYLDQKHAEKNNDMSNEVVRMLVLTPSNYAIFKKAIEHYGLSVHIKTRELAISQNHHEIMKILEIGKGYNRQLERHKDLVHKNWNVNIDSTTKRCTVIGGFLGYLEGE